MAVEPARILVQPFTVYLAPVGTTFPAIDADEASFDVAWVKLGENGDRNYDDDGVTLTLEDTKEVFRGAGETAVQKVFRTEEDAHVGFNLVDLSVDQFALILERASVTTVAPAVGIAGEKSFSMYRGLDVAQHALLARGFGASTETLGLEMQYEFSKVYQEADPAPAHSKTGPAMLACEFRAIRAESGDYAEARVQTDPPA